MNKKTYNIIWIYLLLFISFIFALISLFFHRYTIQSFLFTSGHVSEIEKTAYHEAGHALIALSFPENFNVISVTIVPTNKTLGHVKHSVIKRNNHNQALICLGGVASESLLFEQNRININDVGKGSGDDIKKLKTIMPICKNQKEYTNFLNKTKTILRKNQKILDKISKELLLKKTLHKDELNEIIKKNGPINLN
ncbi:hypothetical protein LFWB_6540 [Candidatus Phytoplasma luffae]|uniref:Peptidase M41 domain-containing protein n=1 Tax=Loofah witches'-broom phytoplasma TaxID=35773 RepID=A0A975IM89_LOWBP|nr:hypothetical protein [Candidatus Phytoplasma luffae]QTX03215.1 hypothetical protein LFWB_6540 [Candidatus Phytoplasma luffae]